jgi:alpha-mannosidase
VECELAFLQNDIYEIAVLDPEGNLISSDLLTSERYPDGSLKKARVLFTARNVPCFGYTVFHIIPADPLSNTAPIKTSPITTSHPYGGLLRFELDHGWIENEYYRLEFDLWKGTLTRLYDKLNQREVLSLKNPISNTVVQEMDTGNFWTYNGPCKGDEFYPLEDRYPLPGENDNHVDFAHQYLGDGIIRQGNTFAEFSIDHPFSKGRYGTRVRIYAGVPRIDIQTKLINNDEKVRYRVVFPTTIQDGEITYEIPFGAIPRPEGEFAAQNWIDYSEPGGGLSLLNRGLPGNNVVDGVMLLSILKCTALEGGYGDMKLGEVTQLGFEKGIQHTFDYALLPHGGDWRKAKTYRHGLEFNTPLIVSKASSHPGRLPAKMSFLEVDGENVVLSSVVANEKGIEVRLYEAEGHTSQARLIPACFVNDVMETDLLGQEMKVIPHDEEGIHLEIKPWEIKTIRF